MQHLGTGALPDLPDKRDYAAAPYLAVVALDWVKGFILPEPPDENQNGSSSCVAQSWSYYFWQFVKKIFSRRDLYCRIFLPEGGAYLREGGLRLIEGQATRDEVPDPEPQTEPAMRDATGTKPEYRISDQVLNIFSFGGTIDEAAAAIQGYKGCIIGVTGSWPGWANIEQPRKPKPGEDTWGHALYAFGYHMHDGKKCVICKSSWGTAGGTTVHHIDEDYFNGATFNNCWTMIPKEQQQIMIEFVQNMKKPGEYGFLVTTAVGTFYVPFSSEDDAIKMANGAKLIITGADGKIDFSKARPFNS